MSMIRCDWCGDLADSDDYPEGFALLGGKDVYICERCTLNKAHEDDDAPEDRDNE